MTPNYPWYDRNNVWEYLDEAADAEKWEESSCEEVEIEEPEEEQEQVDVNAVAPQTPQSEPGDVADASTQTDKAWVGTLGGLEYVRSASVQIVHL